MDLVFYSATVVAGGLLVAKSIGRCEASSFSLMLRSPKLDIPKTLHKYRMLRDFMNCMLEQSFSVYQNHLIRQQFTCRNYAIVLTCDSCRRGMSVEWDAGEMRLSEQCRFSWALLVETARSDHGRSDQTNMNHGGGM